jgi:4-amino-4-deoxy-L-arabinose transferase-like glycosyltransferase
MRIKTPGALLVIFLTGAFIRALDVGRPADGRMRESWREADYASIARNFHREGMDIRYPRIDWRGDEQGFAEMEFPVVPWATALLYRAFGYNEAFGRLISYVFSLLTMLVFFGLARRFLPEEGALFASAFLALAPLAVRVSNALQPESMMLFFYVGAVAAFLRWLDSGSFLWYGFALTATAAAVLVKAPAAHIGFLFVLLIIDRKGWKELFRPRIIIFGILALLPALIWMLHARGFWVRYGLSLGVSNEYHWIGLDFLSHPRWLAEALFRLVRIEGTFVWTLPGLLLAVWIALPYLKNRKIRMPFYWLAAIGAYYLLAIRTTADYWATYYHVVSVFPAALVLGLGFSALRERFGPSKRIGLVVSITFALGLGFVAARAVFSVVLPGSAIITPAVVAVAGLLTVVVSIFSPLKCTAVTSAALAACLSIFPLLGYHTAKDLHPSHNIPLFQCAMAFKPLIPEGVLILASGGVSRDATGKPVAYNASYFFLWLDRKGFNLPRDDETLEAVESFVRRGARYLVLEKHKLSAGPAFEDILLRTYPRLAECEEASLFDLNPGLPAWSPRGAER